MSIRAIDAGRTDWNRFECAAIIACVGLLFLALPANAQDFVTPGTNTNLIGETLNPDGTHNISDDGLKQQQEPACVVSSSNFAHIICIFNDLRASDKPLIQGDSWIGYAMSRDKNLTYNSGLVPGFKSHPNSLNMGFAADPSIVEIPGSFATPNDPASFDAPGLVILNYIATHRDSNDGVLAIQRAVESSREDELPYLFENRIIIVADGSSGRLIDKPGLVFIPDDLGAQSYRQETVAVDGRDIAVRTPSGTLVVAYAVFTGKKGTKVRAQISTDNGVTWKHPTKLSESLNEVTGVSLTAIGQKLVATWRRKADSNNGDAVMRAFSFDAGVHWTKAEVVFELCPFDQPATAVSARTFSFPWTASDGNRFWTFVASRFFDAAGGVSTSCDAIDGLPGIYDGIPRIVGMSSPDGINWFGDAENPAMPFVVDANLDSDGIPLGFQIIPSAIGIKGRINLAWYDTRREAEGLPLQGDGTPEAQIPLIYDYVSSDGQSVAKVLRKSDVWMTRLAANCPADGGCTPTIQAPVRVSQYPVAFAPSITAGEPYATAVEVEAHLTGLKLYGSGTLGFYGDYIDIEGPRLRKNMDGYWLANSLPVQVSDFPSFTPNQDLLVAFADHRDVRIDYNYLAAQGDPEQVPYTPAGSSGNTSAFKVGEKGDGTSEPLVQVTPELQAVTESDDSTDPNTPPDNLLTCAVGQDFSRSRDSNIRASVIADAPSLEALTLVKPLGTISRMFPVILNHPDTTSDKNFCLVIKDQPFGGRASFYQLPAIPPFDSGPPPLTRLPVTVPAGGSATRAVFVFASPTDVVRVDAYEDNSDTELCADDLASDEFSGTLLNRVFISDGSLFDSAYCEANPTASACVGSDGEFASNADQEIHNISLAALNLQAPVIKASVTQEALNLQALNLQAPVLGALNLQALNLQAAVLAALNLQALNLQALNLQALNLQALNLQALNLQALNLQALNLQALNLQALNLQALNLQALNLQALNLQAPSLGDGSAEDPIIYPELHAAVENDEVFYQDITFLVKTNANVATSYVADIGVDVDSLKTNPDDEDPVVQLIAWTPNSISSTSADENGCGVPQAGFQAQVISSVTLDALNLQAVTLPQTISPDEQDPYVGEISFYGKPNQTIGLTVRFWATGGTKAALDELFDNWVDCMQTPEASEDPTACTNAGVGQFISFGASSQGCETADTDGSLFGTDCLNNNDEKIFRDVQSPIVDPVVPPDGFTPDALPYELDPTSSTLTVTWPITGSDTDVSNVDFECTIDGVGGFFPTSIDIIDEQFSATFSYDFSVGVTPVSCDITDGSGNVTTVSFDVEVFDVTDPVFTFVPPALSVEADGPAGTLVTIGDATATDVFAVTVSNDAPALFPLGTTTVTWTATDANGNTATATQLVTIADDTDPVFTFVPPTVSAESDGPGPLGTAVDIGQATATDLFDVTVTNDAPALFPLGTTTVTWTATDANGNTTTATQLVTISDGTAPIFTFVPPAVTAESDGPAGTAVDIGQATASDLFAVTITNDAPALFPLGATTVIWTATDANGNFSTATQLVTVADSTAPVFTFVPAAVSAEESSPAGTAVDIGQATATDLFGVTITNDAPALFPLGTTTVTWTATDDNGNSATATQLVTVTDNTPPVVNAPDVELSADYVDPMDPDWASVPDFASNVTASDTIDGPIDSADISCSRDIPQTDPDLTATDFEFSDTPYSITCTAADSAGNVGSASFLLTVRYLYDINLFPPKGRVRAGSTVPLDWQYLYWNLDWTSGSPVDSSAVDVRVAWARMTDNTCLTQDLSIPEESTGLGDDSGNSDFRYSASSDTWQFSLQTPELAGYYRFAVLPPGKGVENAWTCINLR